MLPHGEEWALAWHRHLSEETRTCPPGIQCWKFYNFWIDKVIFFSFGFRLHRTVSCSEFYLLNAYLKFMTYHIRIGFWNHNPVFLIPFVRFGISAQMTSKVMKTLKYGGNINCWHIAVKLLLLLLLGPKFWAKPTWIFASLAYVYLT